MVLSVLSRQATLQCSRSSTSDLSHRPCRCPDFRRRCHHHRGSFITKVILSIYLFQLLCFCQYVIQQTHGFATVLPSRQLMNHNDILPEFLPSSSMSSLPSSLSSSSHLSPSSRRRLLLLLFSTKMKLGNNDSNSNDKQNNEYKDSSKGQDTKKQNVQGSNDNNNKTKVTRTNKIKKSKDKKSNSKKPKRGDINWNDLLLQSGDNGKGEVSNTKKMETWRLYRICLHPDQLAAGTSNSSSSPPPSSVEVPLALYDLLKKKLKCSNLPMSSIQIIRRSLDARKNLDHPTYTYVVDITVPAHVGKKYFNFKHQPGKVELLVENEKVTNDGTTSTTTAAATSRTPNPSKMSDGNNDDENCNDDIEEKRVIIVGAGPAGLFCALQLALMNEEQGGQNSDGTRYRIKPILMDRGQPVEQRGRDIGALMHRRVFNKESNFAFGEGGAGTWSDGKLSTRIGRNSESVRYVLETLVEFGAPSNILWEGAPHLGTDNLVRLLRNMRKRLQDLGGEIHFGTKMKELIINNSSNDAAVDSSGEVCVEGVTAETSTGEEITVEGDIVVLATGHSARDVYESLHKCGVTLEAKGFAVGFRIEHPQRVINEIQYGSEWGPCVQTGKGKTDAINMEHFGRTEPEHVGKLPVPSYRLATNIESGKEEEENGGDGVTRGVYSFCMCPGGQIVPASTNPDEVCVNGMSFSKRDSAWANSALVVTVAPDDPILDEYRERYGVLAGVEFQKEMERHASMMGGGNWTVPVQRMTDFCKGQISSSVPSSSYRLGVKSSPCHEIYPPSITAAMREALQHHFPKQMSGYFHPDGLLHGVETRTSSPVRVSRDPLTMQAVGIDNLFPAGEGAGFAGGIVSAAVDGMSVAAGVKEKICGVQRRKRDSGAAVGFKY